MNPFDRSDAERRRIPPRKDLIELSRDELNLLAVIRNQLSYDDYWWIVEVGVNIPRATE